MKSEIIKKGRNFALVVCFIAAIVGGIFETKALANGFGDTFTADDGSVGTGTKADTETEE